MNKDIIKKFPEEFAYFLNGGEVCVKIRDTWSVATEDYAFAWGNPKAVIAVVKNDSYAECRRAHADGNLIQMITSDSNLLEGARQWVELDTFDRRDIICARIWNPIPGEYYWFSVFDSDSKRGTLAKFARIRTNPSVSPTHIYEIEDGGWFQRCEPFIGELPKSLKEQEC